MTDNEYDGLHPDHLRILNNMLAAMPSDVARRVVTADDIVTGRKLVAKGFDYNTRVGGLVRDLGDGREIHIVRQFENYRVSIGKSGSKSGWDDSW